MAMLIRSDKTTLGIAAAAAPTVFGLRSWIVILGIAFALAACSTPHGTGDQSPLLVSAGFVERAADTQQKQAVLRRLPRYTLIRRHWNGGSIYAYVGSPACNCLYLGDEAAFARYRQDVRSAAQEGTAESFWEAQPGSAQQQSFAVEEDPTFDPGIWGTSD